MHTEVCGSPTVFQRVTTSRARNPGGPLVSMKRNWVGRCKKLRSVVPVLHPELRRGGREWEKGRGKGSGSHRFFLPWCFYVNCIERDGMRVRASLGLGGPARRCFRKKRLGPGGVLGAGERHLGRRSGWRGEMFKVTACSSQLNVPSLEACPCLPPGAPALHLGAPVTPQFKSQPRHRPAVKSQINSWILLCLSSALLC